MRTRRPSAEHHAAVARRLAELTAQLAEARGDVPEPPPIRADQEPGLAVGPPRDLARPLSVAETEVPPVPVPGRHAARRSLPAAGSRLGWADLVPDTMRGVTALGPPQMAVVAILVAVALALTSWWVIRAQPEQVPAAASVPVTEPASAAPLVSPAPAPSAAASTGSVTVDVAGKVRRPGIVVLATGSRVIDALQAAGGAKSGVSTTSINLARVLVDGEQILVGETGAAGAVGSAAAAPGTGGGPLVNLNTASQTELETLPGVGPVTATAIIAWRTEHGGFSAVEELLEVSGIGDATLQKIAPFVTI